MERLEKSIEIGGRKLTLSTGHVAQQATSAVLATYGETVVLATVVTAPLSREIDYFPLSVEYQERLYAGGRIKGSRWVKREGRPSDEEILTSRLIDRSIRPLFPKNYKKEVQVIVTVLSVDLENSPNVVAGIAVSAALAISSLPWKGPVGFTKVGLKDSNFIVNPTLLESESSDMELYVASLSDAIVMIEAGSNQVPEDKMIEAIEFAQKQNTQIIDFINDFAKEIPVKKELVEETSIPSSIEKKVKDLLKEKLSSLVKSMATKEASSSEYEDLKLAVADLFENTDEKALSVKCFENLFKNEIRNMILAGNRPDGRKTDELRRLSAEVSVLPRTHGSALFQRGQTQALSITTLGASSLEMLIESAEGEESKRYMHHYVFPPFSVGEVGKVGAPSKREIGHGALAERALLPVIPSEDEFPYTIRVVTEILSSNGSTSMASVCGSTLSLMDAGVPIKAMVAGIAMGLVVEDEKNFTVLADIVGLEDANGDMDFKVAGTRLGITALQLDVKTLNLTLSILKDAFKQAKKAREEILDVMEKAIAVPRTSVSRYAPKIKMIRIDPEKIGEIIGSGGKTIKKISAGMGVQIDIEDDGRVSVYGSDQVAVDQAIKIIEGLVREFNAGEIYEGEVKRLTNFGAFVEVFPGKEGLVHVSDMSEDYINDPADILRVGQKIQVRVKEVDDKGRLNLSMLLDPLIDKIKSEGGIRGSRGSYGLSYGAKGKSVHRRLSTDHKTRGRSSKSSGPHFPASRLLDNKGDL
ncbi:MAG: polyribonucleotide nucleotidyltransferase [Patescibacteria group bacterium]|nr:polyribonucleotide nucleotidyltransferase [Patescibacteria group bacterium]